MKNKTLSKKWSIIKDFFKYVWSGKIANDDRFQFTMTTALYTSTMILVIQIMLDYLTLPQKAFLLFLMIILTSIVICWYHYKLNKK
ncbi:MAG: hypothetical protein PHD81_04670 [Candidatus Nanoarchaeia archaeon]|nr:hypothetical protein [Candidatus Nanoarchaeia archaeon]MDD5588370.1 hypothetical protein [Candidatus Nanoarchaeia archaeon]